MEFCLNVIITVIERQKKCKKRGEKQNMGENPNVGLGKPSGTAEPGGLGGL